MEYKERSILTDFLDIISEGIYDWFKPIRWKVIGIYTLILIVLISFSQFLYWGIISSMLSLVLGCSLFFYVYLLAIISFFDKPVKFPIDQKFYAEEYQIAQKKYRRNRNKIFVLMLFASIVIWKGEKYSDDYDFKCSDVYILPNENLFHLFKNCGYKMKKSDLEEIKAIDAINNGYKFCPYCSDYLDYLEMSIGPNIPSRYR